jgi:hypothetical protein
MICSKVDLPHPEGPTMEMNSPDATSSEMSASALNAPNDRETFLSES